MTNFKELFMIFQKAWYWIKNTILNCFWLFMTVFGWTTVHYLFFSLIQSLKKLNSFLMGWGFFNWFKFQTTKEFLQKSTFWTNSKFLMNCAFRNVSSKANITTIYMRLNDGNYVMPRLCHTTEISLGLKVTAISTLSWQLPILNGFTYD